MKHSDSRHGTAESTTPERGSESPPVQAQSADLSPEAQGADGESDQHTPPASRRTMLKGVIALIGGGAASGLAPAVLRASEGQGGNLPPNTPKWMTAQASPVANPAYGQPSTFESEVIRRQTDLTPTDTASWSFTPHQDLDGIFTPNGLFFERHHAGAPEIHPEAHRVLVHGMVERPLVFTMDDLMRFPSVSRIHFLECSGNTLTEWDKPTGKTVQDTHGLVSCGEWTGIPLSTLLQEVGVEKGAKWIVAEGADAAGMTRSIPLDKAYDDAMLAYSQNGERLRPEQGYPVRLLLPGYEGNMNIKWVRSIKVSDQPWHTREETSKYTDLLDDGEARQFTFIMEAKSVITRPSGGQQVRNTGFQEVQGLAWSGYGRIVRVDVSADGGRNWHQAQLQDPVLPKSLTRFRIPWNWDGSPTVLMSRAIDETGYVQPTRDQLVAERGLNSVYHYNALQAWRIDPQGRVHNVHA